MTDRTPIKARFTTGTPTGLGEFESGDTVPIANGGTGATSAAAALVNLGAAANDNLIINGDFQVWQRAVSQSASGIKSADRMNFAFYGGTMSVSRSALPAGHQFSDGSKGFVAAVVAYAGGSGAGDFTFLATSVEGVEFLEGRTVTASFWAWCASGTQQAAVEFTQVFGSGGSNAVTGIGVTTINLTTSPQKFTVTATLPSTTGKTIGVGSFTGFVIWLSGGSSTASRNNSLGQRSGVAMISNLKLEIGSVATPFFHRPYSEELRLCRRYCQKGVLNYRGPTIVSVGHGGCVTFDPPFTLTPTITVTDMAANVSFPASPTDTSADYRFFWYSRTANATAAGYYFAEWLAEAEL